MSQVNLGSVLYKNKLRITSAVLAFVMMSLVLAPVAASAQHSSRKTNRDRRVTRSEVVESLHETAGVLESSDQVAVTQDADSAATSSVNGTVVDVPKDAKRGVTFGTEGGTKLDIKLPNADQATEGTQIASGVVAYESNNGSANAVQATEDGGVRMLTVIDNPSAPTAYDYKVTVPGGGEIRLAEDGSAMVLDISGAVISTVAIPWARDAAGSAVKSYFTTDGQTLTQHVEHNVPGVVYPVTADPWVRRWYGWDFELNRRQTNMIMLGANSAAIASLGIPDPTVSKVLAGTLGMYVGYAGWAYNNGGCMKFRVTYVLHVIPSHYFGGNCR